MGYPELAFFMAEPGLSKDDFAPYDFAGLPRDSLLAAYRSLCDRFQSAVPPQFHRDDLAEAEWRSRMYAALIGEQDESIAEEALLGLGSEFFMTVQWLPGGWIKNGRLFLDSIFQTAAETDNPDLHWLCDEKVRHFIDHFLNDLGDLEYVNIARVTGRLSDRPKHPGRREVYIAEIKPTRRRRRLPTSACRSSALPSTSRRARRWMRRCISRTSTPSTFSIDGLAASS